MGIKCFVNFDRAGETEIDNSVCGYKNGRIDAVICDIAQNGDDRTLIDRFISNPDKLCKEQWLDFIIFVYRSYMRYQPESINNIQAITYIDDSISIESIYGAAHGIKIPFTLSDKTHSLLGIFNDSKFVVDGENHYTNFFYGAPSIYTLADMFGFKNDLASELIYRVYYEQQSRYVYSNLMKESSSGSLKKKTADVLRKMIKFSQQHKYCYENDILEKWPDFPYYIEGDDFRLLSKRIRGILGKKFIKRCDSWFQIELIHDDIKMCNFYLKGKRGDEFCIPLDFNTVEKLLDSIIVPHYIDEDYELYDMFPGFF